jgi:hypothetical protein
LGKIERSALFETNSQSIYGDVDLVLENQMTMNVWINTTINQTIGGDYVRVVELSRTGNSEYSTTLAFSTDGKTIRGWTSNDANTRSTSVSFNLEDNGFFDGKWHLITYSYNEGEAKLYVDSILRETKVNDITNIADGKVLNIGSYSTGTSHGFHGKIDEIQIFNKALSINKIKEIYNNMNSGKNWDGGTRAGIICAEPIVPVAEYRFDCFMNDGYQDFSDTNNSISTTKQSVKRENSSILCRAIDENNTQEKGVTVTDQNEYHVDHGSISFWIYDIDSVSEVNNALTKGAFNIGFKKTLLNKGKVEIDLADDSHITSNREYSATNGEWIFVTVTFEKHGYIKLFMDGELEAKGVYDNSFNNGSKIVAGEYVGQFDELYLFDGRMTEDEVRNLYQQQLDNKNLDNSSRFCDCSIYYPMVSINDIRKDEGDSNVTIFKFAVNLNNPAPFNASLKVKVYDGTNNLEVYNAKTSDNDYNTQNRFIAVQEGVNNFDIEIEVIGDIRMERDEIFYVELYDLVNLSEGNLTGKGTIANDDTVEFNVERVNSLDEYQNDSDFDKKTNLYTQIAKKDFTYAIVSYEDGTSQNEETINDVTVKVELIDKTNPDENSNVLQTVVQTFNNQSRIDVPTGLGLADSVATKYARFKISYPIDVNNTLMYNSTCTTVACLEALPNFKEFRSDNSRDAFTIRPAGFKLMLWADDGNIRDHLATNNQVNGGALAAGYNYELQVKALDYQDAVEESYEPKTYYLDAPLNTKKSPIQEVNATLLFNDNTTYCANQKNKQLEYYDFIKGINSKQLFNYNDVGNYIIIVEDANWTNFDHSSNPSKMGCILDSTSNQADASGLFGCNIGTSFQSFNDRYFNMEVYFQPYYFDVNMSVSNHLDSGHPDFLYMSDLSQSNNMAIFIDGNITAKEKDGNTTRNFTQNCSPRRVDLYLDYTVWTDEGEFNNSNPVNLKTTKGSDVNTQRRIKHNNDNYLAIENNSFGNTIVLNRSDFKDANQGISSLSILYNIQKSLTQTINPIEIRFNTVHVKSENSASNLADNEINTFVPTGEKSLNVQKKLYFTRLASDLENYPLTYEASKLTPLSVELFCTGNMAWCKNIIDNNGLYTTRNNWYTSRRHNNAIDGGVQAFITTNAQNINVEPFLNGRISNLITHKLGTGDIDSKVEIIPDSAWLRYHPTETNGIPFWTNHFRTTAPSRWSGVGQTGRLIESEANARSSNKMDW